jgi:predicted ArsR family transcriptional regulator
MKLTPSMRRVMIALDEHGDMSAQEIAEVTGISDRYLVSSGVLKALREAGLIRVSDWQRNFPGSPTPIYSFTPGANKRKPKPYSEADIAKRWKERVGYYGEEYQQHRKARQSIDHLLRITAVRHDVGGGTFSSNETRGEK